MLSPVFVRDEPFHDIRNSGKVRRSPYVGPAITMSSCDKKVRRSPITIRQIKRRLAAPAARCRNQETENVLALFSHSPLPERLHGNDAAPQPCRTLEIHAQGGPARRDRRCGSGVWVPSPRELRGGLTPPVRRASLRDGAAVLRLLRHRLNQECPIEWDEIPERMRYTPTHVVRKGV